MANISQEACDSRNVKLHGRLNQLSDKVSKILGGIAVASCVVIVVAYGLVYHINYRFSNVEKTLDKIEKKLDKTVTNQKH